MSGWVSQTPADFPKPSHKCDIATVSQLLEGLLHRKVELEEKKSCVIPVLKMCLGNAYAMPISEN